MCTVSFVANSNSLIITSNRDEHIGRPLAFEPREEVINNKRIIYPKDPKAGGSWFALNEEGVITVLLNGAFRRHQHLGNYGKSRGLVLIDVISSFNPKDHLRTTELRNIEPFTLVLWQDPDLIEFRWDGRRRYFKELEPQEYHIWSSTTLYSPEVIAHREKLFKQFMNKTAAKTKQSMLEFHSNDHNDKENGFVIDREDGLKTFSITQAVLQADDLSMRHIDLLKQEDHILSFRNSQLQKQQ